MQTNVTSPVKRHARVDVADVLRGLSVLGIILLHSIEHFNFYSFPDTSSQSAFLNFTDKAIWNGLFFLLGGKAYAIFAMLFGFSFFIQDDNQRMKGNDFRKRFCWRLLLLFIIGNINAMFFYRRDTGDVFSYRLRAGAHLQVVNPSSAVDFGYTDDSACRHLPCVKGFG